MNCDVGEVTESLENEQSRKHENESRYTPFTYPFILTTRKLKDYYEGQMIFGNRVGFPDICLTGEEKPRWKLVRTGDRSQARCVSGAHATICSTAEDNGSI